MKNCKNKQTRIKQIQGFTDTNQRDKSVLVASVRQLANKTEEMSIAVAEKNRSVVLQQLKELAASEPSLNILRTKQQTHEKNL